MIELRMFEHRWEGGLGAAHLNHGSVGQVCASCHGLRAIAYRNLTNVCYSEAEVKLSQNSGLVASYSACVALV